MKRLWTLVVLAVVATGAALAPAPEVPEPEFTGQPEAAHSPTASASVWYCPWVNSGADRDAALLLASEVEGEAVITLPSPIQNEPADTGEVILRGPGSRIVDVAGIVRRGDAPGFVEFDDGPAAASSVVWAPGLLTADRCVVSVPKIWHLPGGTTREGTTLTLRLFNPFPNDVKVSINGTSEFGPEPLPQFGSIDVLGRSWANIELDPVVPFLDDLSLVVSAVDGVIIPAIVLAAGGDEATWTGTGLATTWTFPVAGIEGMLSTVALTNPGAQPATVSVDLLTSEGTLVDVARVEVAAGSPQRVDLSVLADGDYGIALRSTAAIGAVVLAEEGPAGDADGEDVIDAAGSPRYAATSGADHGSTRWLLPGAGGVPDAVSTLWVYNPGGDPLTVSLEPLGVRDLPVEKLVVAPGAVGRFDVPDELAIASYRIDAPAPVVAAWSAHADAAVAFVAGIAVES